MKNNNLEYFNKGNFEPINRQFMKDGLIAMNNLSEFQNQYQKGDIDTLLNELHDSIVGHYLGFELVNTEKHGFDCKYSYDKEIFLESKVASYSAKTWNATFNDTTYEKAEAFKDTKVWLALSIWTSVSDLLCICYGQNEEIGNFLKQKIDIFKEGKVVRSTQSISMSNLIFKYNFRILTVSYTPDKLKSWLTLENNSFRNLDLSKVDTLSTFKEPYFLKDFTTA